MRVLNIAAFLFLDALLMGGLKTLNTAKTEPTCLRGVFTSDLTHLEIFYVIYLSVVHC